MLAQVLQQAAGEVSYVVQRAFRQPVEPLHRRLGGRAGAAGGMVDAGGARDVDAAVDRVNPARASTRRPPAGGAAYRMATENYRSRVARQEAVRTTRVTTA